MHAAQAAGGLAGMDVQQRMQLQFEVEQFLYHEANLLDERRFDDWLALCAQDIHYWMPIRRTTTAREIANEFTAPGAMSYFDDDQRTLGMRVQRVDIEHPGSCRTSASMCRACTSHMFATSTASSTCAVVQDVVRALRGCIGNREDEAMWTRASRQRSVRW